MPWNSQDNNQGGQGPWGRGGGNGRRPPNDGPDLEDMIRQGQEHLRNIIPGQFGGLFAILMLIGVIWLGTGFYRPNEGEQAVVLRFGKYIETTGPGLRYHLPYPIEEVIIRNVSSINRIDSGSNPAGFAPHALRTVEDQPLMLTGDENIAHVRFTVLWFIKDLSQFLFKARNPEATLKVAAESVVREIIAQTPIAEALTTGRGAINERSQELLQVLADEYQLGIQIKEVRLQKVDPPPLVIEAFRDVQRARTDQEHEVNKAQAYENDIIPVAEGDAIKIIEASKGYRAARIAQAEGTAKRFLAVLKEYNNAKEVTLQRMRIETFKEIFKKVPKVILDQGASGVLPHLALPGINLKKPQEESQ